MFQCHETSRELVNQDLNMTMTPLVFLPFISISRVEFVSMGTQVGASSIHTSLHTKNWKIKRLKGILPSFQKERVAQKSCMFFQDQMRLRQKLMRKIVLATLCKSDRTSAITTRV